MLNALKFLLSVSDREPGRNKHLKGSRPADRLRCQGFGHTVHDSILVGWRDRPELYIDAHHRAVVVQVEGAAVVGESLDHLGHQRVFDRPGYAQRFDHLLERNNLQTELDPGVTRSRIGQPEDRGPNLRHHGQQVDKPIRKIGQRLQIAVQLKCLYFGVQVYPGDCSGRKVQGLNQHALRQERRDS